MSRSFLLLALLLCSLAADARAGAPADSIKPRFSLGSTQMVVGFARYDLTSLNSRMSAAGLPTVASAGMTLGIGADIRADRFLLGATYQSMLTRNRSDAGFRTRSWGDASLFDAGFAVLTGTRLSMYPLVGVGVAHVSLNVKELGDFAFDDALQTPRRELGLSGAAMLVHVGMLVERTFSRNGSEFAVGLRFGVTRSVGDQRWSSDENRVTQGPVGMKGSYVRVMMTRPIGRRRDAAFPMVGTLAQALLR